MVVMVCPGGDATERALSAVGHEIEARLERNEVDGHAPVDVAAYRGADATRANFESRPDSVVIYLGHGQANSIVNGKSGEVLCDSSCRVHSRAVIAIACESAKTLGPTLVANGLGCFLGFDEDYIVVLGGRDDRVGPLVADAITLAEPVGKLFDAIKSHFAHVAVANKRSSQSGTGHPQSAISWLAAGYNMQSLRVVGDGSLTLR